MRIELRHVSEAAHNALCELCFDDIIVAQMRCTPDERNRFEMIIRHGVEHVREHIGKDEVEFKVTDKEYTK